MAKLVEPEETKHMTQAALVCRSQGHAIEGLDTALPAKLKGASAQVTLRCARFNPRNPGEPIFCGYEVGLEISLRNGELVARRGVYPREGYLRLAEDKGLPRLRRDDTRGALLARLIG